MEVTIYFPGDWSVGIRAYSYSMTIPEFEPEFREDTRRLIKDLYTELDGEFVPQIYFRDETF